MRSLLSLISFQTILAKPLLSFILALLLKNIIFFFTLMYFLWRHAYVDTSLEMNVENDVEFGRFPSFCCIAVVTLKQINHKELMYISVVVADIDARTPTENITL